MAEGAGRVADFSKIYRQRAHENQRIGMTPQSMPRLDEVDEMLKQSEKIQVSLQRMREVVLSHQQATFAEPPREAHYRPINGSYEHDGRNSFHEDPKGSPAFAGLDPNKRPKRGVRFPAQMNNLRLTMESSEPRLLEDATAAIGRKRRSGDGAPMVPEHYAMPVAYVSIQQQTMLEVADATRLREVDSENGWKRQASHDQLQSPTENSGRRITRRIISPSPKYKDTLWMHSSAIA
jgi:glutamate--cysteine ligase catalytic subunit